MNQGTSNNSGEQALQSVVQDTIHAHIQEIERLRTEVDAKDEEVKNQHQLLDALQRELEEKDRLISSGREQLAKNNSSISELHAILASATTAKDQDRLAITRLESELHSCIAEKARDSLRASFEDRLRALVLGKGADAVVAVLAALEVRNESGDVEVEATVGTSNLHEACSDRYD